MTKALNALFLTPRDNVLTSHVDLFLEVTGFEVTKGKPEQARELLKAQDDFSLAILDISKNEAGLEQLRESGKSLPMILISNSNKEPKLRAADLKGGDPSVFIPSPPTVPDLERAVATLRPFMRKEIP